MKFDKGIFLHEMKEMVEKAIQKLIAENPGYLIYTTSIWTDPMLLSDPSILIVNRIPIKKLKNQTNGARNIMINIWGLLKTHSDFELAVNGKLDWYQYTWTKNQES